jgi:hypothetical protein
MFYAVFQLAVYMKQIGFTAFLLLAGLNKILLRLLQVLLQTGFLCLEILNFLAVLRTDVRA